MTNTPYFYSEFAEAGYVCCIKYNVFGLILSGKNSAITMTARWRAACVSGEAAETVNLGVNGTNTGNSTVSYAGFS